MKNTSKHLVLYLGICALIMAFQTMPIELVEWIEEHISIVLFVNLFAWTTYYFLDDN